MLTLQWHKAGVRSDLSDWFDPQLGTSMRQCDAPTALIRTGDLKNEKKEEKKMYIYHFCV